jgi:ABC-type branched-subunit amino acid transport system ATPase component
MAHHGYVLAAGRNVLDGTGQALLADEEVARLYLGG